MDVRHLRREYDEDGLSEEAASDDPLEQFQRWFDDAVAAGHVEPNAMTLATVDADGDPQARVLLLKGVDAGGFVFFTNYESDKGEQLRRHPRASMVFHWERLQRSVRIVGDVTRVSRVDTEEYFATRPRASQLGAWASDQSRPVPDRDALERRYREVEDTFHDRVVPAPPHWGGYRLTPRRFEFWQGRASRLHDRLRYDRVGEGAWSRERLAP